MSADTTSCTTPMSTRPENQGTAEAYYNEENAQLYAQNARMNTVQVSLTDRALELLEMPHNGCLLLDVGCGTGISTSYLNECGFLTIGVDIALPMLEQNATDHLMRCDVGEGLPFQPGTFDGAVSISALQWLCYANNKQEDPFKRLFGFFTSLFGCLKPGARAVMQFYPEHQQQLQLILDASAKAGFNGRLQVDFPNSAKAKKMYLVLQCGLTAAVGKDRHHEHREKKVERNHKVVQGSREWILERKAREARAGGEVREATKYTGKKRSKMWL